MAESILLYHGTNAIVQHPEIRIAGYNKDFGFGFYCTNLEKQAQRWAIPNVIRMWFVFMSIAPI